jgi:hypothetical protein
MGDLLRARRYRVRCGGWLGPTVLAVLSAAATFCIPDAAYAQTEEQNMAAARALGIEGIKLANEGNCQEALDTLHRAERLYHAPTILGRLGECQVELGLLVAGTENLNRVVREPLPPDAPSAFVAAQQRAQEVLSRALPRIGKLTIVVDAPAGAEYQVSIGQYVLPQAMVGVERPTDPGEHTVTVSGEGFQAVSQQVVLADGGQETVTLKLVPDPAAAAPVVEPQPGAAPTPGSGQDLAADRPSDESPTLAYVALGVGGAGLILGTVFGLAATSKKSDVEAQCEGSRCPPSAQDDIDSMNASATYSTIGFTVGLVGAGVGTYLLLSHDSGEDSGPTPSDATVGSVRIRPWILPGAAGVAGTF